MEYDDEDEDGGEPELPECSRCNDSGKVVAMDGYHEYLGYDYLPCTCKAGLNFVPNPPTPPHWDV